MTVGDVKSSFEEASDTTSKLVRQFSLAGIAVVWILRCETVPKNAHMPIGLVIALMLLVGALGCDLCQYLSKTIICGVINQRFWKRHGKDTAKVDWLPKYNYLPFFFFWGKFALCVAAFVTLVATMIAKL